jgi:hypothetical protein
LPLPVPVLAALLALPVPNLAEETPAKSSLAASRSHDPTEDFIAFDPRYRELKRKHREDYHALRRQVAEDQRRGGKRGCSRQVLDEVKWLLHYTADFARLERRLADLRGMLALEQDPHPPRDQAADGSFGCCSQEWFFKLVRTDDVVVVGELKGRTFAKPFQFLDRINSPDKLRAYLEPLLVSDVAATGVDHRYELSLASSILTRFLFWEVPSSYAFHAELREALIAFEDADWQDPATGYWGARYRSRGKVIQTTDLSTTFHFIHYREGKVNHWPAILRTTLSIKDGEYPWGWLEDGKMSNHHNYDVAAILHLGWPHLDAAGRTDAAREIDRMLQFCLRETLAEDGSFKLLADESSLAGAQLFGVSFLSEIGYFQKRERFWTDREFPEATGLRQRLQKRLRSFDESDAELELALLLLTAAEWGL